MRVRMLCVGSVAVLTVGLATTAVGAATPLSLTVSATTGRHAISPNIYGINFATQSGGLDKAVHVPISRWGGNSTSRYNYLTNTYNTGSDWYFENILATGSETLGSFVATNKSSKITSIVTLPMIGWVSKQGTSNHPFLCSYPRTAFPSQQGFDPYDTNCGNGKSLDAPNGADLISDPTVTSIVADSSWDGAEVRWLASKYGTANKGGVSIYELDNESDIWDSTHHDVHAAVPAYDELARKSIDTAKAIKQADPTARVLGPSSSSYCGYINASAFWCNGGGPRALYGDFAPWYLRQLSSASKTAGHRLLDYFDEHFYPQARLVALSGAGDAATQALRLRSTRSLWDPTYKDESWISDVTPKPLQFIRTMKGWVAKNYPGTKTAITEYNWGALDSINGALAQADVLGIFGREGLDLATLWAPPSATQPGAFAFRMYLNYDGKGAHFGDVAIKAASPNQGRLAIYAAQRTKDKALTFMVINKSSASIAARISVGGFAAAAKATPYRYSSANLRAIVHPGKIAVNKGKIATTYPANSITLLVVPKK